MQLNETLKDALKEVGIEDLNPLQKKAFPHVLNGKHTLIIAPTGYGKTEAALIPLLQRMLKEEIKPITLLYITPLRALNRDLFQRLQKLCSLLNIKIDVRHGDTTSYQRQKQLKNPPHILITTPETLQSILAAEKMGEHLKNVKFVIVDEVHELVGEKRGYQLSLALERLVLKAGEFQRIGLSATVGEPSTAARFLGGERKVEIIDFTGEKRYEFHILYPKEPKSKIPDLPKEVQARIETILSILSKHKQVITFVNTRNMSEMLTYYMKRYHEETEVHHSSLSKDVRIGVERLFKEGSIKHIVATSSLELGIDIGTVDAVIQYGSPRQVIRLIQRVGRSGHRWDKPSVGYIIPTNPIEYLESKAIVELAKEKSYEKIRYEETPLDVLAHQIAGLVLEYREVEVEDIYLTFKKAFPFFSLRLEDILDVIRQLESEKLVKTDGKIVKITGNTRKYYYTNLSMIPDEEKFFVVDVSTKRNVAVLDEEFVSEYIEPGTVFVVKGGTWRVLSIEGRDVLVEPYPSSSGAIPAWIGEQIPVETIVTGKVREYLIKGEVGDLKDYFKDYKEPEQVVVERIENYAIVHTFLGSRGNHTLARLLGFELTRRYGIPVRTLATPYTVIVEFPAAPNLQLLKEILLSVPSHMVDIILERALPSTSLFRVRFLHVARRFGLIRKDASPDWSLVKRLITALTDSPVFRETMKELLNDKLDVEVVKEFLNSIREIVLLDRSTPLGKADLSTVLQMPEIMTPEDPEKAILNTFKKRILEKEVTFLCTYCGYTWSRKVKEVEDPIKCPLCNSPMVSITYSPEEDREVIKKRKEGLRLKRLLRYADIIKSFGKWGIIALSVEGIGASTAAKLLVKPVKNEDEGWLLLLKAEREYFRTRIYWR